MGVREVRRRVPPLHFFSTGGGAGREREGPTVTFLQQPGDFSCKRIKRCF